MAGLRGVKTGKNTIMSSFQPFSFLLPINIILISSTLSSIMNWRLLGFCGNALSTHLQLLGLLAQQRSYQPPYTAVNPTAIPQASSEWEWGKWCSRAVAVISATLMIMVPYGATEMEPLVQAGLRCVCFFYACKTLDLGIARQMVPPMRMVRRQKDGSRGAVEDRRMDEKADRGEEVTAEEIGWVPAPMETKADLAWYVLYLATTMRYHSFDIAVKQKSRESLQASHSWTYFLAWTLGPLLLLPTLTYIFSIAELKCATLLMVIQFALEGLHFLVHPTCGHRLFYLPFSAATMADFWTTHWQACASPFLQSLAYKPLRKLTGSRAAGVLAAFCLSGVWHGWCAAPLVTKPWLLAIEVWALFVSWGVAILMEQWFWGKRQGGMVQRVCVWVWALGGAGIAWRTLECYSRLELLKQHQ